jgi:hypothetical protein
MKRSNAAVWEGRPEEVERQTYIGEEKRHAET